MWEFEEKNYIAIIGDIKDSKRLEDRYMVQEKLKSVLKRVNETYREGLAAQFLITLGDEFQGLLLLGQPLISILQFIEQAMYPVRLRFGIGIGTMSTAILTQAIGADGPAFYHAREAIRMIKQQENMNRITSSDCYLIADPHNQDIAAMINTVWLLLYVIKDSWSDRQREIITHMLIQPGSQIKLAEQLGISQPTVQKSLTAGNYYAYAAALESLKRVFEEIGCSGSPSSRL